MRFIGNGNMSKRFMHTFEWWSESPKWMLIVKFITYQEPVSKYQFSIKNCRSFLCIWWISESERERERWRESHRAYVSVRVWMNFGNLVIVNNNNNMRAQTISQQQIYQTTIYTILLIEFELIPIWRMGQVMHNTWIREEAIEYLFINRAISFTLNQSSK